MTIFMETTEISADKTAIQIQSVLRKYGVSKIMSEFEGNELSALAFIVKIGSDDVPFRLPCRWQAVRDQLIERRKNSVYDEKILRGYDEKGKRIAWRQILRWVEAQMALVETKMVKIEEVFLPYRQCGPMGETVFEMIEKKGLPMLEGPSK